MTAFFRVWRFTHLTSLFSSSRTVSLSALNGGYPNVRLTAKVLPLATSGPPNYLKGFGFKPLSARHETRLCVLMFFNETLSIFDVRVSVASFSFGKRNTTRQLSFPIGYLTKYQDVGCPPKPLILYTDALTNKAHT